MLSAFSVMGSVTITISDRAYKLLKAQKRKGESFSDVILRTFPRGHPARILAYLEDSPPISDKTAQSIREASEEMRRNFNLRQVEL
jgi:predicted CopG family antitoxin